MGDQVIESNGREKQKERGFCHKFRMIGYLVHPMCTLYIYTCTLYNVYT